MKIARYAVAALGLIALLTPAAKADTFVYQVTSNVDGLNLDVIFDLPAFEETVTDITSFTTNTSSSGPLTAFSLSGNSTPCSLGGDSTPFGPCFQVEFPGLIEGTAGSPGFSGPGTSSAFGTTVTITDVPSAAPEPSSLALIPFGLGALMLMRKRMIRPLAV
jgi:hypothetical protein